MANLWAIGDVHNQLPALSSLLDRIPADEELVFVGDLIHKGPAENCAPVVALVQDLCASGRAQVVRGNHDATPGKGRYVAHEGDLSADQAEWLKSLPLMIRRLGVLFLHGGIDASVAEQLDALIEQRLLPREGEWSGAMVNSAAATLSRKNRDRLGRCMRVRFLGLDGKMVSLGHEAPSDPFWARVYQGQYGHVAFGHNPWQGGPVSFDHATGLDAGAGWSEIPATCPTRAGGRLGKAVGRGLVAVPFRDAKPIWDEVLFEETTNE